MQHITEIIPGEPLLRGLNTSGVSKYSDVRPVENYIYMYETVQNTASYTIND